MAIKPIQYETLLSVCTDHEGALELLKRHRPYLETVPSMRRPDESLITLPLPNVRVRDGVHLNPHSESIASGSVVTLPCDVALLMCDRGYEWLLPQKYQHLLSDGTDKSHPLFVVFPETPGHILQGLQGAGLPTVILPFDAAVEEPPKAPSTLDLGDIPELDDIDTSALESPDE